MSKLLLYRSRSLHSAVLFSLSFKHACVHKCQCARVCVHASTTCVWHDHSHLNFWAPLFCEETGLSPCLPPFTTRAPICSCMLTSWAGSELMWLHITYDCLIHYLCVSHKWIRPTVIKEGSLWKKIQEHHPTWKWTQLVSVIEYLSSISG